MDFASITEICKYYETHPIGIDIVHEAIKVMNKKCKYLTLCQRPTPLWNNHHQVPWISKYCKVKNFWRKKIKQRAHTGKPISNKEAYALFVYLDCEFIFVVYCCLFGLLLSNNVSWHCCCPCLLAVCNTDWQRTQLT